MPWVAAAAVAAVGIGSAIMGAASGKKERKAAADALARAQAIIDEVGPPPDLSAKIIYEQLRVAGVLTPDIEAAYNTAVSKVSQITEDPSLREAQSGALKTLQKRAKLGLTAEDRAAYNEIRQQVQRDAEAKRQQALQAYAQRGLAGGGQELAASLMAGQEGAERASAEGDRIAAVASARALEALRESSNLAGSLRSQDFDVNRTRAAAADEFERFNVANQIGRQQRNVDRMNIAQERNLSEKQRIQDYNTAQENAERLRQVEAKRQYWQDKLAYAQARTGQTSNIINQANTAAEAKQQMWSGIGGGAIRGISAFGGGGGS